MKNIFLFILIFITISCGKKNEITPLVNKRSLVNQYGNGESIEVTLRFPLTESSIDAYDDVTASSSPVLGGLFSSFNKLFYKMGTTLGLGKMKLRVHQVLPDIDPEVIQEMKITKIFFTVDDTICETPNIDYSLHPKCKKKPKNNWFNSIFNFNQKEKNFDFIKAAMLQLFPSDSIPAQDTVVTQVKVIYRDFNDLLAKNFPSIFDDEVRDRSKDEDDVDEGESKKEQRKQKRQDRREKRREKKEKSNDTEAEYENISRDNNYQDIIFDKPQTQPINLGRYYRGKKGVVIGNEFNDMIMIKTNDSFNLKKYILEHEKYSKHVESMTSIKGMLFVQLKNKVEELKVFMEDLLYDIESFEKHILVDSVKTCLEGDCIALEINDVNLIDHLKGKKSVIIDTFLHVKDVPSQSFQLKGFVEFKIKFKLEY